MNEKTIRRISAAIVIAALALMAASLDPMIRLAISIITGLPSFLLILLSRRQLGKSFSVMPEARELVTTGLYSRIQHPMYTFLDLFLIAIIIILGWPVLLLAWSILVAVHILQSRREEQVLAAAFGDKYTTYQEQTWF